MPEMGNIVKAAAGLLPQPRLMRGLRVVNLTETWPDQDNPLDTQARVHWEYWAEGRRYHGIVTMPWGRDMDLRLNAEVALALKEMV